LKNSLALALNLAIAPVIKTSIATWDLEAKPEANSKKLKG